MLGFLYLRSTVRRVFAESLTNLTANPKMASANFHQKQRPIFSEGGAVLSPSGLSRVDPLGQQRSSAKTSGSNSDFQFASEESSGSVEGCGISEGGDSQATLLRSLLKCVCVLPGAGTPSLSASYAEKLSAFLETSVQSASGGQSCAAGFLLLPRALALELSLQCAERRRKGGFLNLLRERVSGCAP